VLSSLGGCWLCSRWSTTSHTSSTGAVLPKKSTSGRTPWLPNLPVSLEALLYTFSVVTNKENSASLEKNLHLKPYTWNEVHNLSWYYTVESISWQRFFVLLNLGWQHDWNRLKRASSSLSKYIRSTNTNWKKNYLSAVYALNCTLLLLQDTYCLGGFSI